MEFVAFITYGVLVVASSLLGGFIARLLFDSRAYMNIEGRIITLENTIKGRNGQEAKGKKEIRMAQAVQEGAALLQGGKQPLDIMKALAPKYPDIALELWREVKKGNLF